MLTAKEKIEDLQSLDELIGIYADVLRKNSDDEALPELSSGIERLKTRIATHDYEPLERRRQESIKRLGRNSIYW